VPACQDSRDDRRADSVCVAGTLSRERGVRPLTAPRPSFNRRARFLLTVAAPLVALALVGSGLLIGQTTARPAVPVYQLLTFQRDSVMSARFSPDGETITYSAAVDDELQIFSRRMDRVIGLAPGERTERDLTWFSDVGLRDLSVDGRLILFTNFVVGTSTNYATYLRRTDGSPAVRLGEGDACAFSPDGKWVAAVLIPTQTRTRGFVSGQWAEIARTETSSDDLSLIEDAGQRQVISSQEVNSVWQFRLPWGRRREVISAEPRDEGAGTQKRGAERGERDLV